MRILLIFAVLLLVEPHHSAAKEPLRVPQSYASIQEAIDAAADGDTVLVSPGVYHEPLRIAGKSVILASHFLLTGDRSMVRRTVLDGSVPDPDPEDDVEPMLDQVIYVADDAGPGTSITGFTIRDGDDGIACYAKVRIAHNRFINNVDGIDYEGGGGECLNNEFVANDDDGVDLDLDCAVVVAENHIHDNDDDGIEIRLHEYQGQPLEIVIRDNRITGNGEDGIQLIDYPDLSDRRIQIEDNLIAFNAMVGIGCMADGNTRENYEAASIPEPVKVINNTIAENQYGITGGDNFLVLDNVIYRNAEVGVKNVDGESVLGDNLFGDNGVNVVGSNLDPGTATEIDAEVIAAVQARLEHASNGQ